MFVMNIGVDWETRLMYDDAIGALKTCNINGNSISAMDEEDDEGRHRHDDDDDVDASMPDRIPPHHHDASTTANTATATTTSENKNVYYSVFCSYCRLELAALDMNDEIYYFFGCIASS